jgi:hypothetical protein
LPAVYEATISLMSFTDYLLYMAYRRYPLALLMEKIESSDVSMAVLGIVNYAIGIYIVLVLSACKGQYMMYLVCARLRTRRLMNKQSELKYDV